jgi:hypothetical protein
MKNNGCKASPIQYEKNRVHGLIFGIIMNKIRIDGLRAEV